jgi:hypothetical protein
MLMASFNATVDTCRTLLAAMDGGCLELPNENFDPGHRRWPASTGAPTSHMTSCWPNRPIASLRG